MNEQTTNLQTSVSHISLMQRPFGAPRIHMDENAGSDAPVTATALPADAPESFDTPEAATRFFLNLKKQSAADGADPATAADESPDEGDTDPLDAAPGEDEGTDPEAEKLPPIERPRSWSKDADDDWNALPRSRQEKIAANEHVREADIRQRINKAADADKAAEAKTAQAEQARQQFESKLKSAMEVLEREQLRDFADIKTFADIEKMAAEDPFRKMQWDVHQQRMQVLAHEAQQAESRNAEAKRTEQNTRRTRETAKLIEKLPEYADAKKLETAQKAAAQLFRDLGYNDDELNGLGNEPLLDDHRFQIIVDKAMKYDALQSAKVAVAAKPVPPVQRPGTSRPASGNAERIQALTQNLTNSGSMEAATQLLIARRAANQRRAS